MTEQSVAAKTRSDVDQVADRRGSLIGGGGGSPSQNPEFIAKAKCAALAHAVCMRRHGVPNFRDPTFSSEGGGIAVSSGGPGMNPRSPAFQQAERICRPR
ncbi:MAG: hypothetical protein ACLP4R_07985 [Solirubrobacteraceae bacterium]